MRNGTIEPNLVATDNGSVDSSEKHKMHEWSLNLRRILGEYMIGMGAGDISKLISMMSIHGDRSFDRQFYRSGKFVHQKIFSLSKDRKGIVTRRIIFDN